MLGAPRGTITTRERLPKVSRCLRPTSVSGPLGSNANTWSAICSGTLLSTAQHPLPFGFDVAHDDLSPCWWQLVAHWEIRALRRTVPPPAYVFVAPKVLVTLVA